MIIDHPIIDSPHVTIIPQKIIDSPHDKVIPVIPKKKKKNSFNADSAFKVGPEPSDATLTFFTITNFITEPITIRISSIELTGRCKEKPSLNNVIGIEDKIDLGNFRLQPGDISKEIKSPFKDYTIAAGQSESFYFTFFPPPYFSCNLNLTIKYTDPYTGLLATISKKI